MRCENRGLIAYVETAGKQPESLAFNLITYLLITKNA